jgi:hypothetical protein
VGTAAFLFFPPLKTWSRGCSSPVTKWLLLSARTKLPAELARHREARNGYTCYNPHHWKYTYGWLPSHCPRRGALGRSAVHLLN